MDFSRSNTHCLGTTPWIEQFNEATSFLDGSQIYGSTIEGQKMLRKGQDGLLATHSTLNEFLPSRKDLGLGKFFDKTQYGGQQHLVEICSMVLVLYYKSFFASTEDQHFRQKIF